MKKERSKEIVSKTIVSSAKYNSPRLSCCGKISYDFRSFINYVYTDKHTGNYFLFLFICFIFFFIIVTVAVIHHQFVFLLAPTITLFLYHFVISAMKVKLYEGLFFFIQFTLQVLLMFIPHHAFILGFICLILCVMHIVLNSNLPSLRFYLKVSIICGFAYIGLGMKFWDIFQFSDLYFLFCSIILALIWIIINKLTILQLFFIWIPESIKLFFRTTCCKPKIRFNYKQIFKKGDRFIMKGKSDKNFFSILSTLFLPFGQLPLEYS